MNIAHQISAFNRNRKWNLFLKLINPSDATTVLDVGFSENEYSSTDNYIEKHYPYPSNLTALGINSPVQFKERYPKIRAVQYDGLKFPFGDKTFDVCWSNAVIEHVGGLEKQTAFLSEACRVAKKVFLTTPNRYFPIEVHTRTPLLHYLPKRYFDRYLSCVGKKWATGNYMHLLSKRDLVDILENISMEKYQIIENKLLGFTLDFVLVIDS